MNHLFTYVSAVKNAPHELSIIEKVEHTSRCEADGIVTESCELVIKFDNGVTLRKCTEQDFSDDVTAAVCAECWISYEVIEQPDNLAVMPKRKSFTNPCQEAFWLEINKVQFNT
ncbi:hypothetical protein RND59_18580 [Vibrio ruber]|uniref:hypothetical protein n=1 Tax=Vibrio ruber TaxID=184755 RepID=UPI002892B060|nr:hypothetical protein [Vibrio ruber]WNJ97212.1 hypothetical protein RND59_18580 [Vibrio ruber]